MNLKDIEQYKIFETIAGSVAYGTNVASSDEDIRGIFVLPERFHLSMKETTQQVSDSTNDITFYELKRFMNLASGCNPNIIELLWMPEDCVKKCDPLMQKLIKNRSLFISQKCKHTFGGYAHAQIKKAKGQNKWINMKDQYEGPAPSKFDFCWYIPLFGSAMKYAALAGCPNLDDVNKIEFPMRPRKLLGMEQHLLLGCHAAKLEHSENIYRIYDYSNDNGRGVFRGPNQQLVVESIPKEDEFKKLCGLLIYNEEAYNRANRDWKAYHDWKKNRNDARWIKQESGELDYDAKNMMHCIRLLMSGINILKHGEPIVRFEGEDRQFLLDIREGKYDYEFLMERTEALKEELDSIESDIPYEVNLDVIDELYLDLTSKDFPGARALEKLLTRPIELGKKPFVPIHDHSMSRTEVLEKFTKAKSVGDKEFFDIISNEALAKYLREDKIPIYYISENETFEIDPEYYKRK